MNDQNLEKTEMMGNAYLLKELLLKIDPEFQMPFDPFTGSYFGCYANGELDITNMYITIYFILHDGKVKIKGIDREWHPNMKTNSYLMSSQD